MKPVRVRVFYPADPLGVVPGGIDTFLRGLMKWAPGELEFSLLGMTTDAKARPLGHWTRCELGRREFAFLPLVAVPDAAARSRLPLSARYTWALLRGGAALRQGFDVIDLHRLEPGLLLRGDARPKNAFFHQDPVVVRSAQSDIVWRRAPWAYERMEAAVVPRLASAWCVRDSGVATLAQRYPAQAGQFHFISTWVDTEIFHLRAPGERAALRAQLGAELGLAPGTQRIVSVGRLDAQKDPLLMFDAFARLVAAGRDVAWLVVGDGVMRTELQARIRDAGLTSFVHFLGLRSATQIAQVLAAADVYALSSAYEGMPMALLEALGSGLPVATTDVGEVRRAVLPGVNGAIAAERSAVAFAATLAEVLDGAAQLGGANAVKAIQNYQPAQVLAPVYENYLRLAQGAAGLGRSVNLPGIAPPSDDYSRRQRERVIGVPIDALSAQRLQQVVLEWAQQRQSRYVCFVNVHSVVTANREARHGRVIELADLAASDGAPIAWSLRRKGHAQQARLDGPGSMWQLCAAASEQGLAIGLYGATAQRLAELQAVLRRAFPALIVAYSHAPPFRPLTAPEDQAVVQAINASGAGLLFVSLGCPKQELWMADHRGHVNAVMLGVGAAFDFHTGAVTHAPAWMRARGLEWLHRLASEPRRLWRRYADTNTAFIGKTALELLHSRRVRSGLSVAPALQTPSAFGAETVSSQVSGFMNSKLDLSHLAELLVRVDAALAHRSGRLIEFIASGAGEGTTTLARAYASLAVASMGRKVLVLGGQAAAGAGEGVLGSLARQEDVLAALQRTEEGWWKGSLLPHVPSDLQFALLARSDLWQALRAQFDEVVLDMPATALSRLGLMVASHCDGVVVVLEAERTRAPVAEALVASLRAVKANLLGTVLNKRRYHLPDAVYRRL